MSERDARDLVVRLDGQAALDRLDARNAARASAARIALETELAAKGARWDGQKIVPLDT